MADNIDVTAGTGTTVATDDVGGVHYQKVKLAIGAADTANLLAVGAGSVDTGTPRITLAADDPAVALLGTIDTDTGNAVTALQIIDDWDESDRAKVNLIVGQAGIAAGSGAISATTPRVTLATDSPGVTAAGQTTKSASLPVTIASDQEAAHDDADTTTGLVRIGHRAIAHGTNPTAVAAADRTYWYANRAGIPFVMAGHPNIVTRSATIDDADGAQTDLSLCGTIAAGTKVVVTSVSAVCSSSNSGSVAVRIGFGTANVPAASETAVAGVLLEGKFAAGGGHQRGNGSGILGIGADGEEVRLTCDDPAGGSLYVTLSYYTIES